MIKIKIRKKCWTTYTGGSVRSLFKDGNLLFFGQVIVSPMWNITEKNCNGPGVRKKSQVHINEEEIGPTKQTASNASIGNVISFGA